MRASNIQVNFRLKLSVVEARTFGIDGFSKPSDLIARLPKTFSTVRSQTPGDFKFTLVIWFDFKMMAALNSYLKSDNKDLNDQSA